jgi:hypothetical protein
MHYTEEAAERFSALPPDVRLDLGHYNHERYRREQLMTEVRRTMKAAGVQPGETAPDFELKRTDGRSERLSDLQGRPVVLHFGSGT